MADYQFLDEDGVEVAAKYLKNTNDKADTFSLNTLKIIFDSAYMGGTYSVVGGGESYRGTIEDTVIEIAILGLETTYNIVISCDGADDFETSITTGKYWNHYTVDTEIHFDLEDMDWKTISEISQKGEASAHWAVGDTKGIELDTYINASYPIQGTYYVYIIGFDHNSDIEGENTIHWQFAKDAENTNLCFSDAPMNPSGSTSGGWASCDMRTSVCPTFLEALPEDLQVVIRETTKYTDNTGNESTSASNVTTTEDKLFLLGEYEVFGSISYANAYEADYQRQYDYYAAGNSKMKVSHYDLSDIAWWFRSPDRSDFFSFVGTSVTGDVSSSYANGLYGFAPAFVV